MIIKHPAVTSDIYKLISTLEFDLEVQGHFLPTRIELFQDTEDSEQFRCRMWERDLYHMNLTLRNRDSKEPDAGETDEEVLVERTWEISSEFEDFKAKSPEAALNLFLDRLRDYLNRNMMAPSEG